MILEGGISKNYTQNWDKNGNIYYTDENGQVVDFKVNPFVKLANKAKATAINIGNWLNETNPNSEAYKQKASAIVGLETLPLGLGRFATQGIAKGLTPYVGRKIAQNMAQGIGSGVVGGAIGGGAEAGLNDRNIAIGGLQGAITGGLLGGLGGYGLGKVAQKLNTQTAWHGSPYKFDRFSNEAIGTGEGAQAHGYGHYAAKNKDIAEKYRQILSEIPHNEKIQNRLWSDLKNDRIPQLKDNEERELFEHIAKEITPSEFNTRRLKRYFDSLETPQAKEYADILLNELENNNNQGNLYKLSIPKDDVMLREDLPFSEQPLKVQEALKNLGKTYNDLFDNNEIITNIEYFPNTTRGKDIYGSLMRDLGDEVAVSDELYHNGIKGISYNGGIDGEANVIFNPDDIDIIPYYDNPTSLKEKFINLLNR